MKKILVIISLTTSLSIFGAGLTKLDSQTKTMAGCTFYNMLKTSHKKYMKDILGFGYGIDPFNDGLFSTDMSDQLFDTFVSNIEKLMLEPYVFLQNTYHSVGLQGIIVRERILDRIASEDWKSIKIAIMSAIERAKKKDSNIWSKKEVNTFSDLIAAIRGRRVELKKEWDEGYKERQEVCEWDD